jgi:hypothetical protein
MWPACNRAAGSLEQEEGARQTLEDSKFFVLFTTMVILLPKKSG